MSDYFFVIRDDIFKSLQKFEERIGKRLLELASVNVAQAHREKVATFSIVRDFWVRLLWSFHQRGNIASTGLKNFLA